MDLQSVLKYTAIVILMVYLQTLWAKGLIRQWALNNDWEIIRCRLRLFRLGPFSYFGSSAGQYIFRIEAMNNGGTIRTGYARAGGFFFGLLRRRVEVRWDNHRLDVPQRTPP